MRLLGTCTAILAALVACPGWAMDSCSGSYAATILHPLPAPLVVGLVIGDDSPRNVDLAARFKAGMQRAGITVSSVSNAQMTLRVTVSGREGGGNGGRPQQSGAGFSWWNGGADPQLPGQSEFGGTRQDAVPMTLRLRAEIRRSQADPVAWVATLQCAMQGSDERQLAYDIGTVIGRAIGHRVERKAF